MKKYKVLEFPCAHVPKLEFSEPFVAREVQSRVPSSPEEYHRKNSVQSHFSHIESSKSGAKVNKRDESNTRMPLCLLLVLKNLTEFCDYLNLVQNENIAFTQLESSRRELVFCIRGVRGFFRLPVTQITTSENLNYIFISDSLKEVK